MQHRVRVKVRIRVRVRITVTGTVTVMVTVRDDIRGDHQIRWGSHQLGSAVHLQRS